MSASRWPTYFIPHGGGPCFFMDTPPGMPEDMWDNMADFLKGIDGDLGRRPRAVIVISAHWQTRVPTVHTNPKPDLLYDYYGFPEHTYQLTYPVAGVPELAKEIQTHLKAGGFETAEESQRGLDHGVFIPFKLIYPEADVPMVQLSMLSSNDPDAHYKLGQALKPLRDDGVLIVGSGLSYHNLRAFFSPMDKPEVKAFDDWLTDSVMSTEKRHERLNQWRSAPGALQSHPTPEHLLPLMVAAGAADGEPATHAYSGDVLGKAVSGYRFG